MANLVSRWMIGGDTHYSSKNYGGHVNYPEESLQCARLLIQLAKQYKITHWIDTGDFSYGRFTTLEYRLEVEKILKEQYKVVNGNHWYIKGNHDKATYGMTEYEYYLKSKMFNGSEEKPLKLAPNVTLHMRDYNDFSGIDTSDGGTHILITHGYFLFNNSAMPDYGIATKLDDKHDWFGVDYILCGHIHEEHMINGYISNGKGQAHPCAVHYLPCLTRPAYHGNETPTTGCVDIIDVYDNGEIKLSSIGIQLMPIEQSFDIERIKKEKESKEVRKVDLSDVVNGLNNHEISVGNPEDVITAKADIPLKYREKAIELLKSGLS